jgi:hypothetical protein
MELVLANNRRPEYQIVCAKFCILFYNSAFFFNFFLLFNVVRVISQGFTLLPPRTNRGGGMDFRGGDVLLVFFKISCKPICQVAGHLIVGRRRGPGIPWIKELGRDTRAADRDGHTKDGMGMIFDLIEGAF